MNKKKKNSSPPETQSQFDCRRRKTLLCWGLATLAVLFLALAAIACRVSSPVSAESSFSVQQSADSSLTSSSPPENSFVVGIKNHFQKIIDTYYVIKDLLRQLFSPKTPTNDLPNKDGGATKGFSSSYE